MECGCAICQDPFDAAVDIVTTKCGHVFHNICIDQWLERSSTCPECRRKVCKHGLTKLFFNTSFDDMSGKNASLDALKEQLRAKDLEMREKNEKIQELQSYYARSEKDVEKMHQKRMELEHKISALKREVQNVSRVEAKNQKLLQENNILESELEHLNNVKIIVEGCRNDAKKILDDMQIYVEDEKGKVATRKLATYCSVLKREFTASAEAKTQLQYELTKVKRQMGVLEANNAKQIKQLKQKVMRLENLNSPSSQNAFCAPVGAPKNDPSQCLSKQPAKSTLAGCKNPVTPIPFDFPENKRQKMNVVVLDREIEKLKARAPDLTILRLANSALPSRSENEDSVSRVGYNGLGGHGRIVTGSGAKRPLRKN